MIIKMRLTEAEDAVPPNGIPRQARPISARRLRLLSRLSRGLLGVGRRVIKAGLALQIPDVPQPLL